MRVSRPLVRTALLLPAVLLLAWFLLEQLPVLFAPARPQERYSDLLALPGGCETAYVLGARDVVRREAPPRNEAIRGTYAALDQHFPGSTYALLQEPELIYFGDGREGWFSLAAFAPGQAPTAPHGAVVLLHVDGSLRELIYTLGGGAASGDDASCGGFAPQPRGLRAQLRPLLPFIALAGYGVIVGTGVAAWRLFGRKRP